MQDSLKRKPYKRKRTIDAQQVLVLLKNCHSFFLKTLNIDCLQYLGEKIGKSILGLWAGWALGEGGIVGGIIRSISYSGSQSTGCRALRRG